MVKVALNLIRKQAQAPDARPVNSLVLCESTAVGWYRWIAWIRYPVWLVTYEFSLSDCLWAFFLLMGTAHYLNRLIRKIFDGCPG